MIEKQIAVLAMALVLGTGSMPQISAQSSKIPTDPIGGRPPAGAKVSVKDLEYQVKYQRAFEAILWSMPAISKYNLRRAAIEIGAGDNVIMAYSAPAKPFLEVLTPNTTTPYTAATTDLRKGPVVVEVPPATDKAMLFGQVADNWFITIADIGPIGFDKGKGGKLLLTPPGYNGDVPSGYFEVQSPSYIVDFAFRSIPTPDGTEEDAYALSKSIKIYYLSELPNPEPTKFIDPLNLRWSTLPRYDERWFEDLHEIVNVEPVHERDKVMMGLLKTLGIEKGKRFNPDAKTRKAMRQAAIDAYYYMQQKFLTPQPDEHWWEDRQWRNTFYHDANNGFSWETADLLCYDMRAVYPWFSAIYFPNKVATRPATVYLTTTHDKNGTLLQAGKTYSLTLPKDVPVQQFWSLTIYDRETWAFIYSPEMRPGLSSRDLDTMTKNADGSVTLYFGPKAPKGLKNNWIPTAGKIPYPMFRFYGPEDAFYDKTFKLADVELVK